MEITSQPMSVDEAVTVLNRMFGFTLVDARRLIRSASRDDRQWRGNGVVDVKFSAHRGRYQDCVIRFSA